MEILMSDRCNQRCIDAPAVTCVDTLSCCVLIRVDIKPRKDDKCVDVRKVTASSSSHRFVIHKFRLRLQQTVALQRTLATKRMRNNKLSLQQPGSVCRLQDLHHILSVAQFVVLKQGNETFHIYFDPMFVGFSSVRVMFDLTNLSQ